MSIKVKAIKNGFFGKYRRPGDKFEIDSEQQFSKIWMVKVELPKPEVKVTEPKAKSKVKAK